MHRILTCPALLLPTFSPPFRLAHTGIFDGGFGIELENTFTIEIAMGPLRIEIFKAGVEFKFDFTYCSVRTLPAA